MNRSMASTPRPWLICASACPNHSAWPDNKPNPAEMSNCQPFLEAELALIQPRVIVALGRIAFESVLRIYSVRKSGWKFAHGASFRIENGPWLVCSYHPSQQNTLTGKLTEPMFDEVWKLAKNLATG